MASDDPLDLPPLLLLRVEHEKRPGAHHPYEFTDHTEHTRAATAAALEWVVSTVSAAER